MVHPYKIVKKMVQPELIDLISWLDKNDRNRFEIYDLDNRRSLKSCASYIDLTKNFENPEGYFKKLANDGVRTVQIMQKRKNGSSYSREECAWNYEISTDGSAIPNVAASGQSDRPAATPQQNQPGLGNPTTRVNKAGLSIEELLAIQYDEVKAENVKLISKNERLTESCQNHKEARTKAETDHKHNTENKPSSTDKFIDMITTNPAVLGHMVAVFKPASLPVPGLSSPQLSDVKSTLVDLISMTS